MEKNKITLRAFLLGAVFAAIFAAITVYSEMRQGLQLSSTQIPVMPYLLLIMMVLLLNPLCRVIRIMRAFSPVELMVIFMMGMVSGGLSTYGLSSQLVPIAGNLFNGEWINRQSEWNRYVIPYLNEQYFVAEPGIQAAAGEYKRSLDALQEKKDIYTAACCVNDNTKMVAALEAELAKTSGTNSAKDKELKALLEKARQLQATSRQEWQVLRRRYSHLPEYGKVIIELPAEIDQGKRLVEEAEKKLIALEEPVFKKVAVARRGLPRDQRAFPGIMPLTTDDRYSYFGRLHRLIDGMGAFVQMKQVWKSAGSLPAEKNIGPELTASYCERLARAVKTLSALNKRAELELRKEELCRQEEEFSSKRVDQAARLREISEKKRNADRRNTIELNGKADEVIAEMRRIDAQSKGLKSNMEICRREMDCAESIQHLVDGINDLKKQLSGGNMRAGELAAKVSALMPLFPSIDISLRRYFIGQIPWTIWLKPLALWALVIGLTYIVMMSLNVLIFRQWAHNERLTYPLVELAKTLIGDVDSSNLPPIFRNGLFWIGVAISASVLGWNLFCSTGIVPGAVPLDLRNHWWEYVDKTPFEALRSVRSEIFFTMIGLSFFVPKNISFSLWFFYIVYIVQLLIMVTAGYGQDDRSFPWDWSYLTNFRTAEGQGALFVFSSFVLYKCRKYILCAFFPSSVADLETAERNELRLSSVAFLGCSLGLILMLWLSMGANLYYTIFFYAVMLVITIGLVRAVAEGGLISFQVMAGPFHYLRNFFGLDRDWTSASLFAPLLVFRAILFLDVKTFMAPAMANALKLRDDYSLKRVYFHIAVALAIIVAAVTAVVTTIMLYYNFGADALMTWFNTGLPRDSTFNIVRALVKDAPSATPSNVAWTFGGAFAMAALLFFRQHLFWLPHPIGMIMLVNPIMNAHWFPIFLGWLCNVAVTKYGNKSSFLRAKGFFIGLIVGELIIVVASFIVTVILGTRSGIDLNRNS